MCPVSAAGTPLQIKYSLHASGLASTRYWLACWWNPRTAILAWVPQVNTNHVLQKVSHPLIRNKRACPQATFFFFSRILHLGSTQNLQYDPEFKYKNTTRANHTVDMKVQMFLNCRGHVFK